MAFFGSQSEFGVGIGHAGREARLCLPVRVRTQTGGHIGARVGGAVGQDVPLRNQQDGDAGGCLEEAAADHGVLHRQDAPAEAVVVPETGGESGGNQGHIPFFLTTPGGGVTYVISAHEGMLSNP